MARQDEIIRYVYEVSGDDSLTAAAKEILSLGDVSAETEAAIKKLADELAATKSATAAIDGYQQLAAAQNELADATDKAGLRLKFASEQEAASADVLREKNAALEAAKAAQADYATHADRMVLVERELKAAVKDAAAEQKTANAEWKSAGADLAAASKGYEQAATAQQKLAGQIAEMGGKIEAAGVSTRDLGAAQAELAARSTATQTAIGKIAAQAHTAAASAAELAAETKKHAAEQDQAAAAIKRHEAAAKAAAKETRNLGESTSIATGVLGKLKGVLATIGGLFSVASVVKGLKSIVGAGNDAEQALGQLDAALTSTGGAAGYNAEQLLAMAEQLRSTSQFSTEQIISAQTRMLSYVDVVGAQFPQAMQITIDQAARLGMSVEQSAEIVGKALQDPANAMASLSRQGFRLDESQKALLKSLQETGRMAEAQAIIMDMLTESYGGSAAAQRIGTIAGLWKALTDRLADFNKQIADSGLIDYFKGRLKALDDQIAAMAADGRLAEWARSIADAIIAGAKAVEGAAKFIYDYSAAIIGLAKAYALVKISSFLTGLSLIASGATKATGVVRLLSAAITAIPAVRLAVIGYAAVTLARSEIERLTDAIQRNLPSSDALSERVAALRAETVESAKRVGDAAAKFREFTDVQLQGAEAVAQMGAAQREAYAKSRDGLEKYLNLQVRYYELRRGASDLDAAELRYLDRLKERLAAAREASTAFGVGVKLDADAAANGITVGAQVIANKLAGIGGDADAAKKKIGELLTGFDKLEFGKLGDVALALQSIGEESAGAADRVTNGLGDALKKLSGAELLKFQQAATTAFYATGRSADRTAVVLRTTLASAMDRLKVDAARAGEAFTASGKDILATFEAVSSNALATGQQISAAFEQAINGAKTRAEAEALGKAFVALGERGRVGGAAVEVAMLRVRDRVREIDASIDPLADKFAQFGLKSQAALNAAAASAADFYAQVQAGAKAGVYAQEDVIRAFRAWADAAKAAAADSSDAVRAQVQTQIEARAATIGLTADLKRLGDTGEDAGKRTAKGFADAKSSIAGTSEIVSAVGSAGDRVAGSVDSATASIDRMAAQAEAARGPIQNFSVDLSDFSARAVQAFSNAQDAALRFGIQNSADLRAYIDNVNAANARIQESIDTQRVAAQTFTDTYSNLTETQLANIARQTGGYEHLLEQMQRTENSARTATGEFSMLNNADLSRVQSAAAAVAQQVQAIIDRAEAAKQSMESMADSLQDQIDQINGAQDQSEQRRYENQIEQLKKQAEQAGILDSAEYRDAVARASQLHSLKMQQIADEAAARKQSDAEAAARSADAARTAPTDRTTASDAGGGVSRSELNIKLSGTDLGNVDPNNTAAIQRLAQALLPEIMRQIQAAARNTGRGF